MQVADISGAVFGGNMMQQAPVVDEAKRFVELGEILDNVSGKELAFDVFCFGALLCYFDSYWGNIASGDVEAFRGEIYRVVACSAAEVERLAWFDFARLEQFNHKLRRLFVVTGNLVERSVLVDTVEVMLCLFVGHFIFFSFFNLRFSFGLSWAFFCFSLLPLSFFPLSPISVSPFSDQVITMIIQSV